MKRILFINPGIYSQAEAFGVKSGLLSIALQWSPFKNVMTPLGLSTIAALTPDDFEVDIWDEMIAGVIAPDNLLEKDYALVGVTGYINHAGRVKELGRLFRERGMLTAAGGPGVSSEPEYYRDAFDILFLGEAEYTWPQFISEWQIGNHRDIYRQVPMIDFDSPLPKWDRVRVGSYLMGTVQTTRGCPFNCEFCNVVTIFGRNTRQKPIDRVLEEVSALERRGVRRLFFCDDNFIGNPGYARDLVRELISLNRSFRHPLSFFTQLTLNVAKDDAMLAAMADANFLGVFIGIESPNRESLIEANKPQNYKTDMASDIRKIQSYGIFIQSGMIIGFDHDDSTIFDQHLEFLNETGLTVPMINLLKAPNGTRLWARLQKEHRMFHPPSLRSAANVESVTNFIPKRMTLVELFSGYIHLVEQVRNWRNFDARARTLISQIQRRHSITVQSSVKEFFLFPLLLLAMSLQGRWVTLKLLAYAFKQVPFMLDSVMGIIAFQYLEARRVPSLKESVKDQIRHLPETMRNIE